MEAENWNAERHNLLWSNLLYSFRHHVARRCMMLVDVERNLISIKHHLQHHPTCLLFSGVNNNVALVLPLWSILFNARMPTEQTFFGQNDMARVCFLRVLGSCRTQTSRGFKVKYDFLTTKQNRSLTVRLCYSPVWFIDRHTVKWYVEFVCLLLILLDSGFSGPFALSFLQFPDNLDYPS